MPTTFDPSDCRVFIQDGVIYYSLNCTRSVYIPPRDNSYVSPFKNDSFDPTALRQPTWWSTTYGWLSFLPLSPLFTSAPFEPLCWMPKINQSNPQSDEKQPPRFELATDDVTKWSNCEDQLVYAADLLRLRDHISGNSPPLPSSFRLKGSHRSQRTVKRLVHASREVFTLWMGFLSYVVAQATTLGDQRLVSRKSPLPNWYEHLLSKGFTDPWLSGLMSSTVCSFGLQTPRAGIVMQWTDLATGCPPIDWLLEYHIPMWFVWSRKEEEAIAHNPDLSYLAPPTHLVQEALTLIFRQPDLPIATLIYRHSIDPSNGKPVSDSTKKLFQVRLAPASVIPKLEDRLLSERRLHVDDMQVDRLSSVVSDHHTQLASDAYHASTMPQQEMLDLPAEDRGKLFACWQEFFEKRKKRQAEIMLHESEKDRERRLVRGRVGGSKKTAVYRWEKVSTTGGQDIYMRVRVTNARVDDAKSSYRSGQRIYNAFLDELDLCEFISPKKVSDANADDSDQDDSDDDEADDFFFPGTTDDESDGPSRNEEVGFEDGEISDDDPVAGALYFSADVRQVLTFRYGYLPPLTPSISSSENKLNWSHCLLSMGFVDNHPSSVIDQESVGEFMFQMSRKTKPSSTMYDLHVSSHTPLSRFDFRDVLQVPYSDGPFSGTMYIFTKLRSDSCQWLLGVSSPAAVLYISRVLAADSTMTLLSVAFTLLYRSVPIRTLLPLKPLPYPSRVFQPFAPTSFRPTGYKFNLDDFEAAMLQAKHVLDSPHGRAAMLAGGILGRIAKEYTSVEYCLQGPSIEASAYRRGFVCTDGNTQFWDDQLTGDEIATLCGTYVLPTGHGNQTATKSWFPPPTTWFNPRACDYASFEWTQKAEIFFIGRMNEIRKMKAQPLTVNEWRAVLHRIPFARHVGIATETFSKEFLASVA